MKSLEAVIVSAVSLLILGGESALADTTAAHNWELMTERAEPRPFVRYPEDGENYIREVGGWYTQFNSTIVGQYASENKSGLNSLFNIVYDFSGGWAVTDTADLSWWVKGGRPIGEARDANLSTAIGSALDVNSTLISTALDVQELFWSQRIGERFRYTLGVIDSTWRYDFSSMANNDKENFLAAALINSPAIPFPDRSLAVDALWAVSESIDLQAGMYQTSCDEGSVTCFDDLSSDEWLLPVELTFKSTINDWGTGHYRVLYFETNNAGVRGNGFSINLEQPMGRITPFLRLSLSDKKIASIYRFISMGAGFAGPMERPFDMIGLGFARGKPSDPAKRTETIIETYWRFQLNPFVAISPDIQLVIDPADNPAEDRIWVLGVRLQLDF